MPILALEGPDLSGKTTAFHAMQSKRLRAKFVPSLTPPSELLPFMHLVERRLAEVWRRLYDKNTLYVVDRHFSVTAPVYDVLYGRPPMDVSVWWKQVTVAYFDVPVAELERRFRVRGDQTFDPVHYEKAKKLYETVIRKFNYVRIDGTKSVDDIVDELTFLAESLR